MTEKDCPTHASLQALAATDAIFALLDDREATVRQLEAYDRVECSSETRGDAIQPDLFSSVWHLEEFMLQTWVANFGRHPAEHIETARTLAVTLEKKTSRDWDVNCSAFCTYLRRRRRNVVDLDHFALKYHYLRNMDHKPPATPVPAILASHAKARAKGISDLMLPHSNVLIRHLLHTCVGNATAAPTEPSCIV